MITMPAGDRCFLGLERPDRGSWLEAFLEESGAAKSQRPPQVSLSAQQVIDAGTAARGESMSVDVRTGRPKPLPSPVAGLDPGAQTSNHRRQRRRLHSASVATPHEALRICDHSLAALA
jgi:hypothetical protein